MVQGKIEGKALVTIPPNKKRLKCPCEKKQGISYVVELLTFSLQANSSTQGNQSYVENKEGKLEEILYST